MSSAVSPTSSTPWTRCFRIPALPTLPELVHTAAGTAAGVDGKDKAGRGKQPERDNGGRWAFEDDNVSTHLIRNALGGGDVDRLCKLASIPAPHSRRFRDDITVTVVWWEDGRESQAQVGQGAIPVPERQQQQAKAKL